MIRAIFINELVEVWECEGYTLYARRSSTTILDAITNYLIGAMMPFTQTRLRHSQRA